MGDEEPVSQQQPPADEEQDQNQPDQTTGEPGTSPPEGGPGVSDAPADIPPDSIFGGG